MFQRLASPFREFGTFAGLVYAFDRLLQRALPKVRLYLHDIMVQPIPEKPLLSAGLVKSFDFREISRGAPEVELMPARPDIKESRFRQGARCLGVYRKGEFVGFIWFSFGRYEEDEVRCTYELTPAAQSVFDFDIYLFPEYRMGLGFVATWHGANAFLREHGVRYTYSRLTRFNVASRRAHDHLGWKRIGTALYVQLGRAQIMVASIFPYVHLSLQSKRVRLRLRPDVLGH
jgi:hypothetical protein